MKIPVLLIALTDATFHRRL